MGTIECEHGDCRARVVDVCAWAKTRRSSSRRARGADAGRGAGPRRSPRAPRDRGEPHGHAPAARGAARAARRARPPGGLLRRAGQAALRLQPRPARSATQELRDVEDQVNEWIARATTRCARSRRRSTRPSGSARWRCSARSTATSCAWWRSATGLLARAVRRHARALDRGDRDASRSPARVERGQRAPHRGDRRAGGGRDADARRAAARGGAAPARPASKPPGRHGARRRRRQHRPEEVAVRVGDGGGDGTKA